MRQIQSRSRARRDRLHAAMSEALEQRLMLAGDVVISEFMAKNTDVLQDNFGNYSDWIELHNAGDATQDLSGWYLTDTAKNLTEWQFPSGTTLAANAFMIVYASGRDIAVLGQPFHTNFSLSEDGEYLALVQSNGTTIQYQYGPEYPQQVSDVSYGMINDNDPNSALGYFSVPTPGAANDPSTSSVTYSQIGGGFTAPVTVSLSDATPGAQIYYTTNGSAPTNASTLYTGPLTFSDDTMLRTIAYSSGETPSLVTSQQYFVLDSSVASFNSNIGLVVIDTYGGTLNEDTQINASMMVLPPPTTGNTTLTETPDYTGRIAINVRGQTSASFPKQQYHIDTIDENGNGLDASPLGLPSGSDWVLYAPYSEKALMQNQLAYMWSNEIGEYAVKTQWCEVFLNQSANGQVDYNNDYWGIYLLEQHIYVGSNGVDINKIIPNDDSSPNITGGYLWAKDKPDPDDPDETGFTTETGQNFLYEDPDEDDLDAAQKSYLTNYVNQFETALYGPNFTNPNTGYAAYINVMSFVDNWILVEMAKNIDGFRLSTYYYKDENGKITMGPIWDYNLSMGNANYNDGNDPTGWYHSVLDAQDYTYFSRLTQDPAFMELIASRWEQLRQTVFSTAQIDADIQANVDLLTDDNGNIPVGPNPTQVPNNPVVRNFEKWNILGTYVWPNAYVGDSWMDEVNYLENFMNTRVAWMDTQLDPLVPSGPPGTPQSLLATPISGVQVNLTWTPADSNASEYEIDQSIDGGKTWTVAAQVLDAVDSYLVGGLQPNTPYSFRVIASNDLGSSAPSNVASATTASTAPWLDLSSGFSNAQSSLQLNGNATLSGSSLQLTNGNDGEASSAFATSVVNDTDFSTAFTFQLTDASADGFTFTMQNDGPTALGGSGGDLGYAGIGNSVAVKFDLYNNNGEGTDSTGVFVEGDAPFDGGSHSADVSVDMTSSGVSLESGDIMLVVLQYNNGALLETVTDTSTGAQFSHSYSVNIPSEIGANTAYVGFTAGTGGESAIQDVLGWTFTSYVPSPPPPPPPVSGVSGFGSVALNAASGGPTGVPAVSSDSKTLTITTNVNNEADSAFYNAPIAFQNFDASFTYTDSGGSSPADGITFTLQNSASGDKAVGTLGSGLGYSTITTSFAVELNIYQNSSTAVATNGTNNQTLALSNTGTVNLRSGDPINVTLTYNSGQYTLVETLTDTVAHATYTTLYSDINLPTLLSSTAGSTVSTAYIGFTGGTGGANALQTISNFTYSTSATPAPTPTLPAGVTSVSGFANNFLDGTNNDPAGVPSVSTNNSTLTLTTAATYQSSAAFYDVPVDYGNFSTRFTYQETGSVPADGAAFVLQEEPSALGQDGGQLGYGPSDPNSFSVEFNVYQVSSTAIGAGGSVSVPYNTRGNTGSVNLASGDPINVTLAYSSANQTLTETLLDATTMATYRVTYNNVNLSQILGNGASAYVGFTGATGGAGAGQTIRNFSYSADSTTSAPASGPQVNLTGYYNSYGIQTDGDADIPSGSPTNGSFAVSGAGNNGFDGAGNQLSDTYFAAQEDIGAYGDTQTFDFGPVDDPGSPNTISAEGQTINLPQGHYGNISFIGAAVDGNQSSQVFTVNYTDGTSQKFTVGLSDWFNGATFAPNEVVAIPMTYRLSSTGAAESQGSSISVYEYQLSTNASKTVASITLPMNTNDKILAINVNPTAAGAVVAAPTFSQYGGDVPSGYLLGITNPNSSGSIYYTLDGSDPVTQSGTLSPTATLYTGAITINATTEVQAVIVSGATISPVTDFTFDVPITTVHVTELDYDPNPSTDGTYSSDELEFIELKNFGTQTVNLDGASFTNGIDFTFGNVSLAPGQVGVVVSDPVAFEARYGDDINVLGSYLSSGTHFSNSGEEVTLEDATGETIADFTYSPSWYPTTAGDGPSLEVVDPASNPNLNLAASWQPSPEIGGTPGVDDSIPTAAPQNLTSSFVNQQVVLSWDATPGAATYNVYRGSTSGGEGTTPIATGITSPTFTDTTAVAGDTYYYTVAAVDPGGISPQSNEVQVVVPQTPYVPLITTQPLSQIVDVGQTATFTAAATGYPVPTVQWQVSSNGGQTYSPIAGATSTTYSFTVNSAALDANEYEAVFTNSQGSTPTNPATLTAIAAAITAWNFDTSDVTGKTISTKGVNTDPDPSTGSGTSSSIGMALVSGPDESGMTGDTGSSDTSSTNQAWKVVGSNGWSSTTPIGSQGAQFMVSTAGYQDISLQFDLQPTTQGEGNLAVEYTTNGGTTWTNATQLNANGNTGITVQTNTTSANTIQGQYFNATGGQLWYNRLTVDFNGVAGVANNPNFGIRLVNASTGADCVNSTGQPLNNTSGNWRFDEVDINGALIPPIVSGISPSSGPTAGGTSVTITGTGFTGATAVDFGGTPATSFTVNAAGTQITAVDPVGSGTVDVTVVTPNGTSATSLADQFTYGTASLPSWLAAGSAATWNASTSTLTVTGSATITADPGSAEPNIVASGSDAVLTIAPTTSPSDVHIGGVTLTNGASIVMSDVDASQVASGTNASNHVSDHNVLVIGTFGATSDPTISIDSASKLDLGDNDLIVHAGTSDTGTTDVQGYKETSELKAIEALAATGRNVAPGGVFNGTWTGNGLTSSAAATADDSANAGYEQNILAVEQNSDMYLGGYSKWTVGSATETLGANDIIVKYTYNGDLNLDGAVDGNAATIFSTFYDNGATSGNTYAYGDLNGDGKIDGNDATIFSTVYGNGLAGSGLPQL